MVQEETISNYLYQTDLPAFTEMTACWWYDGEPDADNYSTDYFISMVASSSECADRIVCLYQHFLLNELYISKC